MDIYIDKWKNEIIINNEHSRRGHGQNKLRTYRTFKTHFETETYVKVLMTFAWRKSFAKFRAGVAPLRYEILDLTGRYENLAVNQRTCFNCRAMVESEHNVLPNCPLYEDLQLEMYSHAFNINPGFYYLSDEEKIRFLFSSNEMIKTVAKTCKDILDRRRRFLYT